MHRIFCLRQFTNDGVHQQLFYGVNRYLGATHSPHAFRAFGSSSELPDSPLPRVSLVAMADIFSAEVCECRSRGVWPDICGFIWNVSRPLRRLEQEGGYCPT
jgi:hypothetical protein